MEQHRTHLVVGGNLIQYQGQLSTPTSDLVTAKILFNSVLSTQDAKFLGFRFKGTGKGPSGDPAAEDIISDLGEACRLISTLRKAEDNIS